MKSSASTNGDLDVVVEQLEMLGQKMRKNKWWSLKVIEGKWEDGKATGRNIEMTSKPNKENIY